MTSENLRYAIGAGMVAFMFGVAAMTVVVTYRPLTPPVLSHLAIQVPDHDEGASDVPVHIEWTATRPALASVTRGVRPTAKDETARGCGSATAREVEGTAAIDGRLYTPTCRLGPGTYEMTLCYSPAEPDLRAVCERSNVFTVRARAS